MRTRTLIAIGVTLVPAFADEPKLPKNASPPGVALASAKESDGKTLIRLRVVESVPTLETRTETAYETVTKVVGGKTITQKVPVQRIVTVTVMRPARWREVNLTAGAAGVEVRDLEGKEVSAKKLASLLEKETPVLLSTTGPVDPFFTQLAKEGTLVVIMPPDRAVPQPGVRAVAPVAPVPAAPGVAVPPPPPPLPPPPLPKKD